MGQSFPNVSDQLFLLSHPKFWILILGEGEGFDFWRERGFLRREKKVLDEYT